MLLQTRDWNLSIFRSHTCFISSFDSQCKTTQKGSYLEGFDVRRICRSYVETLHVGLEHALHNSKYHVTVQPSTFYGLLAPRIAGRLTFLWMDMVAMFWSTTYCTSLQQQARQRQVQVDT